MKYKNFEDFLKSKNTDQTALKEKSVDEVAGLYNEYNKLVRDYLESSIEAKASKEDIEAIKNQMLENTKSQFDSLSDIIEKQGLTITRMLEGGSKAKADNEPGLADQLRKNLDKLKGLKNDKLAIQDRRANAFGFELKAAGNMSIAGNVTGQIPQAYRLPGFNELPQRRVRFLDFLQGGSISSNLVEWVYEANEDGTAGATAEAAAKKQIDFDFLLGSQKVEKYTAYIKVTDEMLDDIDFMQTAINRKLQTKLLQSVELAAYSGNGTTPNLNGVRTVATAFAAGTLAGTVDNANEIDVLNAAIDQIRIANQTDPNVIWMYPTDITRLKMVKVSSSDKRYVENLAMIAGQLSLDGIPIIPTTLVTAGTYLIGDFTKANMLTKGGIMIEVGYDSDDFTKNFKTVRAEWRGVVFVEHNDRTAFVAGTFSTDKAALETA